MKRLLGNKLKTCFNKNASEKSIIHPHTSSCTLVAIADKINSKPDSQKE
jgi:hypothetical protein